MRMPRFQRDRQPHWLTILGRRRRGSVRCRAGEPPLDGIDAATFFLGASVRIVSIGRPSVRNATASAITVGGDATILAPDKAWGRRIRPGISAAGWPIRSILLRGCP